MAENYPFWLINEPLILASSSITRRLMLEKAGIPLNIVKPEIDEKSYVVALEKKEVTPKEIALFLAEKKAEKIAQLNPENLVLAADQSIDFMGKMGMKAENLQKAVALLKTMRGREHNLHSAAVLRKGRSVLWKGVSSVKLKMRNFSNDFLASYAEQEGENLLKTVGCYAIEESGIQLFEKVEGEYSAILGLPLFELLEALRQNAFLMR